MQATMVIAANCVRMLAILIARDSLYLLTRVEEFLYREVNSTNDPSIFTESEIDLMKTSQSCIPAIKAYRERTNSGLRDAKEAVENYMKENEIGKYVGWAKAQAVGITENMLYLIRQDSTPNDWRMNSLHTAITDHAGACGSNDFERSKEVIIKFMQEMKFGRFA